MSRQVCLAAALLWLFFMSFELNGQELRFGTEWNPYELKQYEIGLKAEWREDNTREGKRYLMLQSGLEREFFDFVTLKAGGRYSIGVKDYNEGERSPFRKIRLHAGLKMKSAWFYDDFRVSKQLRYLCYFEEGKQDAVIASTTQMEYKLVKDVQVYFAVTPYFGRHSSRVQALRLKAGGNFMMKYNKLELYALTDFSKKNSIFHLNHAIGLTYKFK